MFQTLHEISKNLVFVFVWKYVWKYVKKKKNTLRLAGFSQQGKQGS